MYLDYIQDFPAGTVDKNLPTKAGDMGWIPGQGRYHMLWSSWSSCHTATEPMLWSPRAATPGAHKPQSLCSTTRETTTMRSLYPATKSGPLTRTRSFLVAQRQRIHRQCMGLRRCRLDPWVQKIPWRRVWQPIPVFLPGESHGQRSLTGYSPSRHKESDTVEVTESALTTMHGRSSAVKNKKNQSLKE